MKKSLVAKIKDKKAYSLMELLVSMAIFGMLMIMLTQILFSSLKISQENYLRSVYRESLSEVFDFMKRDIRNANVIVDCQADVCHISHTQEVIWTKCADQISICKYVQNPETLEFEKVKETVDNIYVKDLKFEMASFDEVISNTGYTNNTIIVTVKLMLVKNDDDFALAQNDELPLDVQQIVISTRNVQ